MKNEPKWLYRLESKTEDNGLWYSADGKYVFGIGSLPDCKTKDLPMGYDERYRMDGRHWFSSCSREEDLKYWYSLDDALRLIDNGFVFTRYLATEYTEYEHETTFIKDSCLAREVIDPVRLFENKNSENESVTCPLCGDEIKIIEYFDLVREFGIDNWKDIHGFIPVCYHCGSDFLMHDTKEEAIASISSIPRIKERESFCINCREDVEYNLGQSRWEASDGGVTFWYTELSAFCPICGEELYVGEINDINCETREREYRRARDAQG